MHLRWSHLSIGNHEVNSSQDLPFVNRKHRQWAVSLGLWKGREMEMETDTQRNMLLQPHVQTPNTHTF